ncbi:hypothetical protein BDW22DRAFT_956091 [Trametopsis cervina]|nr:hypothetical protein BDW22DRAFT_956091 [Trametopsis cervina]
MSQDVDGVGDEPLASCVILGRNAISLPTGLLDSDASDEGCGPPDGEVPAPDCTSAVVTDELGLHDTVHPIPTTTRIGVMWNSQTPRFLGSQRAATNDYTTEQPRLVCTASQAHGAHWPDYIQQLTLDAQTQLRVGGLFSCYAIPEPVRVWREHSPPTVFQRVALAIPRTIRSQTITHVRLLPALSAGNSVAATRVGKRFRLSKPAELVAI